MDKNELSRIADLAGIQDAPHASVLVPDVRSGSTFSYNTQGSTNPKTPAFLVVWFYTVDAKDRALFVSHVNAFEGSASSLPPASSGVDYRGTYSVSISSASPDFEYRTVWALSDLSKLKNLNDYIHNAGQALTAVLGLISVTPAMRTEIMGLTINAKPKAG